MKKTEIKKRYWIIAALILAGFAAVAIKWTYTVQTMKNSDAAMPVYGNMAPFKFTERSGIAYGSPDLHDKVWIANFMFTSCAGVCPLMSNKMQSLQQTFQDQPDIRFVSFSVDPERDKPEVLKQYAERYKADPQKWLFLTGDQGKIHQLAVQHFHLGVNLVDEEERLSPDQFVAHSSKFVLVDRKGQIRGYYETEGDAKLDPLVAAANVLLKIQNPNSLPDRQAGK